MKRLNLYVVGLLIAAMMSAGCGDKDDENTLVSDAFDGKITVTTVVRGNNNIKTIKAVLKNEVIASGDYVNGGFTLTLPSELDIKYFSTNAGDMFEEEKGINVSEPTAQIAEFTFLLAYDNSDNRLNDLWHGRNLVTVRHVYTDKDVTATGNFVDDYGDKRIYSVSLKKGWNKLYYDNTVRTSDGEHITTKSISDLSWWYGT